ncbi:uncharacterized protein RHOBADRAFT_46158 [Rhodotorula graminis WP1]|uniref:Histone H1 n=1 Tax=Rhodotorula graminis (strain WP1) TaxID=578459 RepID=A0A0P9IUH0_RHOGW|nr:uncharacterized protein RHOBADRAFT_46158 [Rhodotorula graminis WP1]KPV73064.1 hypothetical protein RHOBADRAFT_46158 [Rhodotorula graminis WP1]
MGKAPKTSYVEMVERAVDKAGKGEKVSRRKIKEYIRDTWSVKIDSDSVKDSLKTVIAKEVDDGYLIQEKDSFRFSPKGKKHFVEKHGSNDEEGEEDDDDEEEEDTPSKPKKGKKAADEDTE